MAKKKKIKKENRIKGDALDGHATISSWEDANGRGFWGSSANGYIYDKDAN